MRLGCMDGVVPPVSLVVELNSGGGILASLVTDWDWAHPALLTCFLPCLYCHLSAWPYFVPG